MLNATTAMMSNSFNVREVDEHAVIGRCQYQVRSDWKRDQAMTGKTMNASELYANA
jgi:hypothetical protein